MTAGYNEVEALSKKFFFLDGPTGWRDRQQSQLTNGNIGPQLPHNPGPQGPNISLPSFASLFPPQQPAAAPASAQNNAGQNTLGLQLDGSTPAPDPALVSNQALSFHPALLELMQTPPIHLRRDSVSLAYLQLAFTFNLCQHDPNHEWTHGRPSPELYRAAMRHWNSLNPTQRYGLAKQAAAYVAQIPNAAWHPPTDLVLTLEPVV